MGETKLQRKMFTFMMCTGMVVGMTTYNIILHIGFSTEVFKLLINEVWLVFTIAIILDLFLVGPLAKNLVFSILKPDAKKIKVILSISFTMVTSMVFLMSIFGSILMKGLTIEAIKIYPQTVFLNFIVALPLNMIIVSPLARILFIKLFPPKTLIKAPITHN